MPLAVAWAVAWVTVLAGVIQTRLALPMTPHVTLALPHFSKEQLMDILIAKFNKERKLDLLIWLIRQYN